MSAWRELNRLEELTYPLDGAASVVRLVAEQIQDNQSSSALWLVSDVIQRQTDDMSEQISLVMQAHKGLLDRIQTLEQALAKAKKVKK